MTESGPDEKDPRRAAGDRGQDQRGEDSARVLVEACVTSAEEAAVAETMGAGRVELCRDLATGGLTPTEGSVRSARAVCPLPMYVMIRPEPGPFVASPKTVSTMLSQIEALVPHEVDGIVLGLLDSSQRIDGVALRELVAASPVPVTFHRSFDGLADPMLGLELLVEAGVARVLTSGGAAVAWEGRATLSALVEAAGDRIAILGGGRVRGDHVRRLVKRDGSPRGTRPPFRGPRGRGCAPLM